MLSSMLYDWDMFDNLMNYSFGALPVKSRSNDNGIGWEFDMPGVPEDSIEVVLENRVLTITGERDGKKVLRAITLPATVNSDSLEARYENGVLQIIAPYAETAKPRRIELNTSIKHNELV